MWVCVGVTGSVCKERASVFYIYKGDQVCGSVCREVPEREECVCVWYGVFQICEWQYVFSSNVKVFRGNRDKSVYHVCVGVLYV